MPGSPSLQRTATRTSNRQSSAAIEAWLEPDEPPTQGADGKYIRPAGQPPVEGYKWHNGRGVWVPGKHLLQLLQSSAPGVGVPAAGHKRVRKRSNRSSHKRKIVRSTHSKANGASDEEEDDEDEESKPTPAPAPPAEQNWYHPNSDWEEPIPAYDEPYLTLYEKYRTPRQVPTLTATSRCAVAAVQQEVRCGICLECVVRTRIVRECRHRFCEPCVERALTQQKECPICRTSIPSRRSLEPDLKFDSLLTSVIGRHLRSEDEDEGEEEAVTPSVLQQAINKKREAMEKRFTEVGSDSQETEFSNDEGEDSEGMLRNDGPALIKIVLHRELLEDATAVVDSLAMPYLRLAGDAPVLVLKNFLRSKHRSKKQYSIWSILDGGPEILSDMTRLQFVANYLTDEFEGDYMPLFYRETKTPSSSTGAVPAAEDGKAEKSFKEVVS